MTTIFTIYAVLGFGSLLAYPVWWLCFSNERIFNTNNMGKNIYKPDQSVDQLKQKLRNLQQKQARLEAELASDYSEQKLRELNITDHHIITTEQRLNGSWVADDVKYKIQNHLL